MHILFPHSQKQCISVPQSHSSQGRTVTLRSRTLVSIALSNFSLFEPFACNNTIRQMPLSLLCQISDSYSSGSAFRWICWIKVLFQPWVMYDHSVINWTWGTAILLPQAWNRYTPQSTFSPRYTTLFPTPTDQFQVLNTNSTKESKISFSLEESNSNHQIEN